MDVNSSLVYLYLSFQRRDVHSVRQEHTVSPGQQVRRHVTQVTIAQQGLDHVLRALLGPTVH